MVNRVHGNTTSLGPAVALDGELVLGARSLEEGLVGTATTGDDTDHTAGAGVDDLLGTGGQLDTGLALVGVVADDGDVTTRGTAKSAAVTDLLLDVGDDGTLGHLTEREDVADGKGGLLAGVDELAGVHALVGDEGLADLLELVGVTENDLGEGSTATCKSTCVSFHVPCSSSVRSQSRESRRSCPSFVVGCSEVLLTSIVDDVADYTTDVAMTLSVVERAELGGVLVHARVGSYSQSLVLVEKQTVPIVDWFEAIVEISVVGERTD